MNKSNLPDDLAAFEAELQALPRPRMPAALRARVLADLQAPLAAEETAGLAVSSRGDSSNGSARWWFAATAAAVGLLWLNLSWMTARMAGVAWKQASSRAAIATIEKTQTALTALVPDLSPDDSQRFALTLYSGTQADLLPTRNIEVPSPPHQPAATP